MVTIRRYTDSDQEAVRNLHRGALEDTGAFSDSGPWDDDLDRIQQTYIHPGGDFLVGELNGTIVAMGALRRESEYAAEIRRMRVHPAHQRRGIGTQMLKALEERAISSGYRRVYLDTTTTQIGAQRLYEKHGYREFKRKPWREEQMIFYEKIL